MTRSNLLENMCSRNFNISPINVDLPAPEAPLQKKQRNKKERVDRTIHVPDL